MTHVMLDLETMGSGSYAAIISIGAAAFTLSFPQEIISTFYSRVSLASSVKAGLRMDPATVEWWLEPERAEAWASLQATPAVELDEALLGFSEWFCRIDEGQACVWGNGATFDNVILSNAYQATGLDKPWAYNKDRCFRTLKSEILPPVRADEYGTKHNALDDAIAQAKHLQKIVNLRHLTVS